MKITKESRIAVAFVCLVAVFALCPSAAVAEWGPVLEETVLANRVRLYEVPDGQEWLQKVAKLLYHYHDFTGKKIHGGLWQAAGTNP